MEEHGDGGPAFPMQDWARDDHDATEYHPGMSLRDWFAGQALIGIVSAVHPAEVRDAAVEAYAYADAMLAERAKRRE